jgi:hypothetical protein
MILPVYGIIYHYVHNGLVFVCVSMCNTQGTNIRLYIPKTAGSRSRFAHLIVFVDVFSTVVMQIYKLDVISCAAT